MRSCYLSMKRYKVKFTDSWGLQRDEVVAARGENHAIYKVSQKHPGSHEFEAEKIKRSLSGA